MDGLISEQGKTKLIFFAVDDETNLPTKKEMREYFPNCSFNVYKTWGHFRNTLEKFEAIFQIRKSGINAPESYHSRERIFTHIFRIDTDKPPNLFFALRFSSQIKGFYEVSCEDMNEIASLIKSASTQSDLMRNIIYCSNKFKTGIELAQELNLVDKTMSSPDKASIKKLFTDYGMKGEKQLFERIKQFIEKIKWQ
jgi:hypothetical protein